MPIWRTSTPNKGTPKPRQAQAMLARAIAAGVPFARFTADEIYGQAKYLQAWLEDLDMSYMMAIRCSDTLTVPEGEQRADALIAAVPGRGRVAARPRAPAAGPPVDQRRRWHIKNASSRPRTRPAWISTRCGSCQGR